MAATVWKVKQYTGQHEGRTLFKGIQRDARRYVETNFPRPHIDPGSGGDDELKADVHLVSPDGVREHFLGAELEEPWQLVDNTEEGGEDA